MGIVRSTWLIGAGHRYPRPSQPDNRKQGWKRSPGMNLQAIRENRIVFLVSETVQSFIEDKALRLAAALAYYSVFSIAPLLVIAISLAGLVFGVDAVKGQLEDQMRSYIGKEAASAVQALVQSAAKPKEGWIGTVTGFVVLLIGASGVFGQLKDALNTIWEVKPRPGSSVWLYIQERLLSFGMVLVIGFLLLTSLLLTTALSAVSDQLGRVLGLPEQVWVSLAFAMSMGMVTGLFAIIFKVLPDAQVRWRHVWLGAFVTAVLFEIGKFALGFYLGRESTVSSYGASASVVLLLLWIYYAACILLLGAEFTQAYSRLTDRKVKPAPNAVPITRQEREQEGMEP